MVSATDFLQTVDIDSLALMFQSKDYALLKEWVAKRKYTMVITQQLADSKDVFLSIKRSIKSSCAEYGNLQLSRRDRDQQASILSSVKGHLEMLFAFPFVTEETKRILQKLLHQRSLHLLSPAVDKLTWQQDSVESPILDAVRERLDDPIVLLTDLLEVLQENFRLMKEYAKEWIHALADPVKNLLTNLEIDIFKLEATITFIEQQSGTDQEESHRQIGRLKPRLEELSRIKMVATKRTDDIVKTAQLTKDIASSIQMFISRVSDQLVWLEKRASYLSTLTEIGQNMANMKSDTREALGTMVEDMEAIRSKVGRQKSDLSDAIVASVHNQETLNSILKSDTQRLASEFEVAFPSPNKREPSGNVEELMKLIKDIGEL